MIWKKATADDFQAANAQTGCINLLSLAGQQGGMAPLPEIAEFWAGRFETVEDLDLLKPAFVVRYKLNSNGQAGWQYSGSANYTAEEYAEAVRKGETNLAERKKILALAASLRSGLTKDIVLTTVLDNSLGVRLIVDGLHRATALNLLDRQNPSELSRLLTSKFQIMIIELRSRWAHVLYPFDFLDFCAQRGP